jgi:hypothetical protein
VVYDIAVAANTRAKGISICTNPVTQRVSLQKYVKVLDVNEILSAEQDKMAYI